MGPKKLVLERIAEQRHIQCHQGPYDCSGPEVFSLQIAHMWVNLCRNHLMEVNGIMSNFCFDLPPSPNGKKKLPKYLKGNWKRDKIEA